MTTGSVRFTAACPWCTADATWHTSRNTEGTAQRTRIVCETWHCPTSSRCPWCAGCVDAKTEECR